MYTLDHRSESHGTVRFDLKLQTDHGAVRKLGILHIKSEKVTFEKKIKGELDLHQVEVIYEAMVHAKKIAAQSPQEGKF